MSSVLSGCSRSLDSCCPQVAGTGNVMGGFIAPPWKQPESWIADLTGRSFTFSLVNSHNRAVKLKLTDPPYAAWHSEGDGVYLCYTSIMLMQKDRPLYRANANRETKDTQSAPCTALDDEYEIKCGLAKPTFDLGPGFMSGTPGGKFACAEIEVFAMQPQRL